jgi:hypothetical protein
VFRTGYEGEADMAAGIMQLQRQGCKVIVDDVGYASEVGVTFCLVACHMTSACYIMHDQA